MIPSSLKAAIFCVGVLVCSVAGATSPPAIPPDYCTFDAPFPQDGDQNALRDGVISLTFRCFASEDPPKHGSPSLEQLVTIALEEAPSGVVVPLEPRVAFTGTVDRRATWVTGIPLKSDQAYVVRASLDQDVTRPSSAVGETSIEFSFRTGTDFAPPIVIDGELSFEVERTLLGPTVRVKLPAVSGGLPDFGYHFTVWLTNDMPRPALSSNPPLPGPSDTVHSLANGPSESFAAEEVWPVELSQTIRPCVTLEVSNLTLDATSAHCLNEELSPSGCGCRSTSASGPILAAAWLVILRRRR